MTSLAIIRQHYRPDGGGERFIARAITGLQQQFDVTVVCRDWQGEESNSSSGGSAFKKLIVNPGYKNRVQRERSFADAVLQALATQASETPFDIVQSHERIPGCSLYRAGDGVHAEWLAQQSRFVSPLKRWWLKRDPFHRYMLDAERRMFTHPSLQAVICNSAMVKQEIIAHFGVPASKLHVIYNAVSATQFSPPLAVQERQALRANLGIPEQALVAVFVGSGFFRKGLQVAIQAMAKTPSCHLLVVGQDKQVKKYRALCKALHVDQRVHFVGMQKSVLDYYGVADLLVHPAIYEPYPNVVVEALTCGLPIIVSDKTGAAETVNQFSCGAVIASGNSIALAQAIEKVGANLVTYQQSALRAADSFSEAALLDGLTCVYSTLIKPDTKLIHNAQTTSNNHLPKPISP